MNKTKTIAIISPHYRGPRHRLENIALSLREKFIVYLFIFSSDVPKNMTRMEDNATFYYIKIPFIIKRLRFYYLFYVPIIIFSALKADILFTNEAYKIASIAGLISKIMHKKVILFYGTLYFEELKLHTRKVSSIPKTFKTGLYKIMELISASTVDMIISPDSRVSKYFQKHILKPKIVNWINIGTVNTEQFIFNPIIKKEYRKKLSIPSKDTILLYVGDISERDGADITIKVFEKISNQRPDVWLVMIGTGPIDFLYAIKRQISVKKIDNIILTGHIPHSLIQNYMMTADIAILPMQEPNCGIGNIVVELMSIGIPTVASNYSEIKRIIINGKTGFVAEDEDEFIEKTMKLINNEYLRQKIGRNYREYALNNFSYHAFSEKFKKIVKKV